MNIIRLENKYIFEQRKRETDLYNNLSKQMEEASQRIVTHLWHVVTLARDLYVRMKIRKRDRSG